MSSFTNPLSLDGKLALITGGSRGIGHGIALELARQGADVVVNYRVNTEAATDTVAEIEALGRKAVALQANMGNPEDVAGLFQAIEEKFGGLDILVLNAATGWRTSATEIPIKVFNMVMTVNVLGPWLCVEHAVPLMKARGGGRIVLITSPGTRRVFPEYAVVGVSKAAVETLVRYLAVELAPYGIIVNAVAPSMVLTDAIKHVASPKIVESVKTYTPMKRTVEPDEVGYVTAFLCSERAEMICGQIITMDGGLFLKPFMM